MNNGSLKEKIVTRIFYKEMDLNFEQVNHEILYSQIENKIDGWKRRALHNATKMHADARSVDLGAIYSMAVSFGVTIRMIKYVR